MASCRSTTRWRAISFLESDVALYFDETANMVRGIRHRHRRRLPQFPLGKGERVEAAPRFPAVVSKARVCLRTWCRLGWLARSSFRIGNFVRVASAPSRRSMSSSDNASRSTSSVTEASTGAAAVVPESRSCHPCGRR